MIYFLFLISIVAIVYILLHEQKVTTQANANTDYNALLASVGQVALVRKYGPHKAAELFLESVESMAIYQPVLDKLYEDAGVKRYASVDEDEKRKIVLDRLKLTFTELNNRI